MALPSPSRTAICSIATRSTLHFCRVLMKSAERFAPSWARHALIVDDEPANCVHGGRGEVFTPVSLGDLAIPHPKTLLFRHSAAEAMAALKPWLVRRVLDLGFDRVLCLDAALCLSSPPTELDEAFAGGGLLVLTPHPNLGFFGIARQPDAVPFLQWCQRRFAVPGGLDLEHGFFSNSRWIDLASEQFGGIVRIAHPGYDAGHRTLTTRRYEQVDGEWRVDGEPLRAFHFGSLGFASGGPVRPLVEAYFDDLAECDRRACERSTYRYSVFADGSPIPPIFRKLYAARPDSFEMFGPDPFATMGKILEMPFGSMRPALTILVRLVWEHLAPLKARFPRPMDSDRVGLARAFLEEVAPRFGIPDRSLQSIRDGIAEHRESAEREPIGGKEIRRVA